MKMQNKTIKRKRRAKRKPSIQKKRKSIKIITQKGGLELGRGSYGVVYGDPAPPSEELPYSSNPEFYGSHVGKFAIDSRSEKELSRECEVGQQLRAFPNLTEYILLPVAIGRMDYTTLKSNWGSVSVYGPAWRINKLNIDTTPYLLERFNWFKGSSPIVVYYEKGGDDLHTRLKQIKTLHDIIDFDRRLLHIRQGLVELHKSGFVHTDLRIGNTVIFGESARIIDIADITSLRSYSEMNDKLSHFNKNFYYYIYPRVCYFIDEKIGIEDYNFYKDNIKSFTKMCNDAFTVNKSYNQWHGEGKIDIKTFEQRFLKQNAYTGSVNLISKQYFETPVFFKFVDTYSFGIMILQFIGKINSLTRNLDNRSLLYDFVKFRDDFETDLNSFFEFLNKLYELAYYCCIIQPLPNIEIIDSL
jgi:serine/threonine protein kinase